MKDDVIQQAFNTLVAFSDWCESGGESERPNEQDIGEAFVEIAMDEPEMFQSCLADLLRGME